VFERNSQELDQMGIWLPQVTALGQKLRLAGLSLASLSLTVPEAVASFEGLLVRRSVAAPTPTPSTEGADAVSVRNLSFRYPAGPPVLRHIALDVPSGAFFALLGPNGSGKTTLAAHLAAILPPPMQCVRILGDDITRLTTAQITARVGYVFQNPEHQFVEQHVEDELAYSLRLRQRPPDEIRASVEQLLESFGLTPYRRLNPFALSQGQKRRLSVATMLIVGQRVLVLDEPTFGQDRHTAHALMERLRALHQDGVTVFVITHDMQLVADYAERVAVLVEGEIRFVGTPAALFADQALLSAASLRALPLHELARALGVAYGDGSLPLTLRNWFPFFGLEANRAEAAIPPAQEGTP
jgi:energy-coupling factor transport system ATP-binding protein